VHSIAGESESGKTWLALLAVKQELLGDRHVWFLDFEDNEHGIVGRLRDMCVPDDAIGGLFRYFRPDSPLAYDGLDVLAWEFAHTSPALTVIDGVTEAMVLHGYELKDNTDIAKWLGLLPKRLARWGCAVVQIDHVAKYKDGPGRFAIGGQHELAGIDGAAFAVEMVKPFGRGLSGFARVTVTKDRPGWIRQHAPGGIVGELHVDSDPDGGVSIALQAPETRTGTFRPTVLMEHVSQLLDATRGLSKRAVRQGVHGKNDTIDLALETLIAEGFVTVEKDGPARRHFSARPYRQLDEEGEYDDG
jgi:hypothetical protein